MQLKQYYSISEVEQETGISALRLRIWENRYQLLRPSRTTTNIRQYRAEDVRRLLLIKNLLSHGYKISQLAQLSLEELNEKIKAQKLEDPLQLPFIQCIQEMDESIFHKHFSKLKSKHGFEYVMEEVLFPLLNRSDELWLTAGIEICKEQFLANLVRQKIIAAIEKESAGINAKAGANEVLLFLPDREQHELGLLYIFLQLRKKGIPSTYLGSGIDLVSLHNILQKKQYPVIVTVITSAQVLKAADGFETILLPLSRKTKLMVIGNPLTARKNKISWCSDYKQVLHELQG